MFRDIWYKIWCKSTGVFEYYKTLSFHIHDNRADKRFEQFILNLLHQVIELTVKNGMKFSALMN